jgi:hypothetical protein
VGRWPRAILSPNSHSKLRKRTNLNRVRPHTIIFLQHLANARLSERQQEGSLDHWFDRAAKSLAVSRPARRDVVRAVALGGLAAFLPETPWVQTIFGAEAKAASRASPAPCTRKTVANRTTTTISASVVHQGRPLTLQTALTSSGRNAGPTFTEHVELGGALVYDLRIDVLLSHPPTPRGAPPPAAIPIMRVAIDFGAAVRGPRHILVEVRKDRARGIADGRLITAETKERISVDPELKKSLQALATNAGNSQDQCRANWHTADAENPCQQCPNDCNNNLWGCFATAGFGVGAGGGAGAVALLDAILDVIATVGSFFAGGIFGALASCAENWINCNNNCNKPGGPCCTLQCSADGVQLGCCGQNEFCCGGSGTAAWLGCCQDGPSVCVSGYYQINGYTMCCPAGSASQPCTFVLEPIGAGDLPSTYIFCQGPNQTCCGFDTCNSTTEFCAGNNYGFGICCAKGDEYCTTSLPGAPAAGVCCKGRCLTYNKGTSSQNQVCCAKPNVVCGEGADAVCCKSSQCRKTSSGEHICCETPLKQTSSGKQICCATAPCGDSCCSGNAVCNNVSGKCCPGKPCGTECCTFSENCVNGKCVSNAPTANCQAGLVPCQPQNEGGGPATAICCPPNMKCCAGKCCTNVSDLCCAPGSNPFGCYSTCLG